MEIVGLIMGVIGAGKDYQAQLLVEKGFVRMSFATAMRAMAEVLFGYAPGDFSDTLVYEAFKERVLYHDRMNQAVTGRLFLQKLGTEAGRDILGRNIWVDSLFTKAQELGYEKIVISDVRFENEVTGILDRKGKVTFCDYRSERYDATNSHPSEALAQRLLKYGLADGAEITYQIVHAIKKYSN